MSEENPDTPEQTIFEELNSLIELLSTKLEEVSNVDKSELSPIERSELERTQLITLREYVYGIFKKIEEGVYTRSKLIDAFSLVKDSPQIQQDLLIEMQRLGIVEL